MKHTIFLGLGSNVGDKKAHIKEAIDLLSQKVIDIVSAPLYETKPMYVEDQDMFVNTVVKGHTKLSPHELFIFVKDIETKVGRIKRFRNGPREIDIDILFYDDLIYKDEDIEIPHPRIAEREFVLKPFMDIAPEFEHPGIKKTMKKLESSLRAKRGNPVV